MKSNYTKLLMLALVAVFALGSCSDDDDNDSKWVVTLGAQSNETIGAFYSLSEKKVYTQDEALLNQEKIDLLCFYEHTDSRVNDMTLSSPYANITGIFTDENGDEYFTAWTTKNFTTITPTSASSGVSPLPEGTQSITAEQFDQIKQGDVIIATYFNTTLTSSNKKAKLLAVGDIYSFLTQDGTFGIFKVIEVSNPESVEGWIKFELKTYTPVTK
ncbi:MAG: hypothetical protein AB7S48_05455 [Bacteroidales bacterium]